MQLLLASLVVLVVSGALSYVYGKSVLGDRLGVWGGIAGCALGLVPAVRAVLGGAVESLRLPWAVPGGSFHVALDALSALFLVPILALGALGAIYGIEYLEETPGLGGTGSSTTCSSPPWGSWSSRATGSSSWSRGRLWRSRRFSSSPRATTRRASAKPVGPTSSRRTWARRFSWVFSRCSAATPTRSTSSGSRPWARFPRGRRRRRSCSPWSASARRRASSPSTCGSRKRTRPRRATCRR
jgi:hypothetical protein